MTPEKRIMELEQRIANLESLFANTEKATEQRMAKMHQAIAASGYTDVGDLAESIRTISIVVMGDEDLGIEPLRPMVVKLQSSIDRAKWIAGSLATSNLGTIAAWISTLLK